MKETKSVKMNFTKEEVVSLLVKTTQALKRCKTSAKRVRRERAVFKKKLTDIESLLSSVNYDFTIHDRPSPREDFGRQGQVELKEEILAIINANR